MIIRHLHPLPATKVFSSDLDSSHDPVGYSSGAHVFSLPAGYATAEQWSCFCHHRTSG